MHIAQYKQAVMHDENRVKKLLLNKKEIIAIASKTDQPSYTIIPLEVFDMGGKLKDYEHPEKAIKKAIQSLPKVD